jgi:hypothetical protein
MSRFKRSSLSLAACAKDEAEGDINAMHNARRAAERDERQQLLQQIETFDEAKVNFAHTCAVVFDVRASQP